MDGWIDKTKQNRFCLILTSNQKELFRKSHPVPTPLLYINFKNANFSGIPTYFGSNSSRMVTIGSIPRGAGCTAWKRGLESHDSPWQSSQHGIFWVNYNNSLSNLNSWAMAGDDFPQTNHDTLSSEPSKNVPSTMMSVKIVSTSG